MAATNAISIPAIVPASAKRNAMPGAQALAGEAEGDPEPGTGKPG